MIKPVVGLRVRLSRACQGQGVKGPTSLYVPCVALCCSVLHCALVKGRASMVPIVYLYSVLQRVAAWCSVLQRVAVLGVNGPYLCSVLHSVAVCCSVLQYIVVCWVPKVSMCIVCCKVLQCAALCCGVLQCQRSLLI